MNIFHNQILGHAMYMYVQCIIISDTSLAYIPDKGIYQFMNYMSIMCIPNSINMHMHGLAKLLMRDFTF